MEPSYCPFCSKQDIETLDPTEMFVDTDIWIIYHYVCQACQETFDKIYLKNEDVIDDEDIEITSDNNDENRLWS